MLDILYKSLLKVNNYDNIQTIVIENKCFYKDTQGCIVLLFITPYYEWL